MCGYGWVKKVDEWLRKYLLAGGVEDAVLLYIRSQGVLLFWFSEGRKGGHMGGGLQETNEKEEGKKTLSAMVQPVAGVCVCVYAL